MSRSRWLLATILALALGAPAAAQTRPEVVELRFRGNDAFTRAELASAIATRGSECDFLFLCWIGVGVRHAELDPGALEADAFRLKVYYYERGFREARISADTAVAGQDEVRVTFRIEEGRPVRVTQVQVNGLPERVRGEALPLRTGQPFDVVAYEATRDTLQARLWNTGFARGQVLLSYAIRSEAPYQATVIYDVYPGTAARFGRIEVSGTEQASPELVHRMLTFDEGDRYDRSALLRSQRNLYRLQIFSHADVQADTDAEPDSIIPVTVRVAEGSMHRVRLGGGANNVECLNVEGEWTSRNFLGDGRRLTLRGRLGNLLVEDCGFLVNNQYATTDSLTGLLAVDFTQPWFFGPRNSIGLGIFGERQNVPDVFFRSTVGGYVSLSRSMGGNAVLTLAYRPELTELSTEGDLFFCVNFVACTFEATQELQEPHWLSPITLSYTIDQTNAFFTPSEGYIVRVDLEHAASYTASDFAYTRLLGESSQYIGEADGMVLATRIRGGIGIPHGNGETEALGLHPQKRFFAGGANSVRGFNQYRLGPTVLGVDAVPWLVNGDDPDSDRDGVGCTMDAVNAGACDASALPDRRFDRRPSGGQVLLEGNIELRFPLPVQGGRLRGALFVDAGQVWADRRDVALGEIVATPGFGLRYQSPIGPIRVDAAFNPQGATALRVLSTRVQDCNLGETDCQKVMGREPRALVANTNNVVELRQFVLYGRDPGEIDSFGDLINRFQLHFSIGQAF